MGALKIPCQSDKILKRTDNEENSNFNFNEVLEEFKNDKRLTGKMAC
jgi:hypothetical protein